ncbi:TPA: EAL domain-containing protein [Klebsiella variicola subsp. variicola]|nr:EAL domain-containing protein [Klebsiella variicola]HCI6001998.1 EAL domain-containing protein [Klebsiella variicola subsp. variicola]HCI6749716.1 EAL domain-containing protein [Klebsiella variicola subsp. variicola]
MRRLLPALLAIVIFVTGAGILNTQLWLSARADAQAAARHALSNMNTVLDEARHAQETARAVVDRGCSQDGQFRLGTEAALRPHLRTILILRQGNVVCSSLAGNRALLKHVPDLPDSPLQLVSAEETAERESVLVYQTRYAGSRILVTISADHVRDALDVQKSMTYFLRVGEQETGGTGPLRPVSASRDHTGQVSSDIYPFAITFSKPPFFSADRFFRNGGAILAFLLIVSGFAAYLLYRYMNKPFLPEETLRLAIARGQIVPFYQPVVDGREGTVRGVEVLARWKHPTAGYISPAAFIPLAEKSGQIVPLTHSLMTQVIGHMNILAEKLPDGFHISLNFSASHITSPTFVEECLHFRSGFSRQDLNLVIEVTEREPLDMSEDTIRTLNGLHEKGFGIALDDFGTGYSGLSYLDTLDIDYIKIDSTFVSRVNASAESTVILDVVLDLARKLSIRIVAEGVETREQADYLRHNHVVFMQGYYYFRPVSLQGLAMILLSRPRVRLEGTPP